MPVGCLSSRHVDSSLYLSTIQCTDSTQQNGNGVAANGGGETTANGGQNGSISAQADTIALMQQTLLIQIFRREAINSTNTAGDGGISNGNGGSNGSTHGVETECPTCQAFSNSCCQEVEGLEVFQEVLEANSAMFWNLPLVKAVLGLKYQGYVCPGILVTLTSTAGVKTLEEAWSTHTLATPPGYTIYRLGLSGGCSVTPFQQLPSPRLADSLCLILYKLKQAECVADMNTILSRLARDFPALNSANANLPATVHAALGSLIKKRKVYYTGKGYFLVSPDPASIPKFKPKKCYKSTRKVTRENTCQTDINMMQQQLYNGGRSNNNNSPPSTITAVNHLMMSPSLAASRHAQYSQQSGQLSLPPPAASPSCSSSSGGGHDSIPPMMTSLNSKTSSSSLQSRTSPRRKSSLEASPRHSPQNGGGNGIIVPPLWGPLPYLTTSPGNSSADSSLQESPRNNSGPGVATLERSQSLRISKKTLNKMSKGGSLRLSKKEALSIMNELEESGANKNKDTSIGSDDNTLSPSPKKMERKNSFLGRFFGRKKSNGGSPKKEILTFSAQFPPPELEAIRRSNMPPLVIVGGDINSVETQTPPHVRRKPARPNINASPLTVLSTAAKNGMNGGSNNNNYYGEREYGVITRQPSSFNSHNNPANRPLPKSPSMSGGYNNSPTPNGGNEMYDSSNSHIYSQPSHYGAAAAGNNLSSVATNGLAQQKPPPPAYTSAPPYHPKISTSITSSGHQLLSQRPSLPNNGSATNGSGQRASTMVSSSGMISSPGPQRPALVTSPTKSSQQKQVHFAATPRSNDSEDSPRHSPPNMLPALPNNTPNAADTNKNNLIKSPPPPVHRNQSLRNGGGNGSGNNSDNSSGHSSLTTPHSGPSSLDSVLYDDTLIVIEKSNKELELRLDGSSNNRQNGASPINVNGGNNSRLQLSRHRVDTIHNNRHLEQEVIYEDDDNGNSLFNGKTSNGHSYSPRHTGSLTDISRSSSQSTLKPDYQPSGLVPPDHPSLSDLGSIADLSAKFQSLTARKLMAGLSISSIDTLLEVNIDAESKIDGGNNVNNGHSNFGGSSMRDKLEKLDESTETIDFGVI